MKKIIENICGIKVSKILEFPATPGFGEWKRFFPDKAKSHPAKINLNLLSYLISQYTEEGDIILDPMAGSGSTGVISVLNGRNAILIELEEKFCKWIRESEKRVVQQRTFVKKGKVIVIQGDARNISGLLKNYNKEISSIITSPPYANLSKPGNKKIPIHKEEFEKRKNLGDHIIYHDIRPERKGTGYEYYEMNPIERYGSEENIDRLSLGEIDKIITSPPYTNSLHDTIEKRLEYDNTCDKAKADKGVPVGYSEDSNNIGNLKDFGTDLLISNILFSPPYESSLEGGSRHTKGGIASRDLKMTQTGTYATVTSNGIPVGYSINNKNIGNLKINNNSKKDNEYKNKNEKPTYISEMKKVYQGCFEVLKSNGKMIIIIKDFIRNFKVIKLHEHTRILCESCGFIFDEMLAFKLPIKSFWRVIYQQKYGDKVKDIELLNYEFILILHKPFIK